MILRHLLVNKYVVIQSLCHSGIKVVLLFHCDTSSSWRIVLYLVTPEVYNLCGIYADLSISTKVVLHWSC